MPLIVSFCVGAAVPNPTFPAFVTMKCDAVDEPMANDGTVEDVLGFTDNTAYGDVVPMPTLAVLVSLMTSVSLPPLGRVLNFKCPPNCPSVALSLCPVIYAQVVS